MSHSSISANRDYVHGADHGDLTNPAQAAGFVSDPMLTPISVSSMPHPVLPDPTPSEDPTLFDQSTRHPNSHYHPDAKLSKKKRAKKLGLGAVTLTNAKPGSHVGGRTFTEHDKTFTEHDKAAHEKAEGLAHKREEEEEEEEEEDDEEGEDGEEDHTEEGHSEEAGKGKEQGEGGQSLKEKAGGVLSGAQEKASGLLASAQEKASGVLETVRSAPVVGSLLNKVGLGSGATKGEDTTKADNAQAKKEDELVA